MLGFYITEVNHLTTQSRILPDVDDEKMRPTRKQGLGDTSSIDAYPLVAAVVVIRRSVRKHAASGMRFYRGCQ